MAQGNSSASGARRSSLLRRVGSSTVPSRRDYRLPQAIEQQQTQPPQTQSQQRQPSQPLMQTRDHHQKKLTMRTLDSIPSSSSSSEPPFYDNHDDSEEKTDDTSSSNFYDPPIFQPDDDVTSNMAATMEGFSSLELGGEKSEEGAHIPRIDNFAEQQTMESMVVGDIAPSSNIKVPLYVTWSGGGRAVYITGSFNNWKEKVKLNKSLSDFSALIHVSPGTHELKFIVDNEWKCSEDLPISTDADGNLVNWLEIGSYKDMAASANPTTRKFDSRTALSSSLKTNHLENFESEFQMFSSSVSSTLSTSHDGAPMPDRLRGRNEGISGFATGKFLIIAIMIINFLSITSRS